MSSPIVDCLRRILNAADVTGVTIRSYREKADFEAMWSLDEALKLTETQVVVWDGVPTGDPAADKVNVARYVTPYDWLVALVAHSSGRSLPAITILDVAPGDLQETFGSRTLPGFLVDLPSVSVYRPAAELGPKTATVESAITRLLGARAQGAQRLLRDLGVGVSKGSPGVKGGGPGDVGQKLADLWRAHLTRAGDGGRHDVSNLVAPLLMAPFLELGETDVAILGDVRAKAFLDLLTALRLVKRRTPEDPGRLPAPKVSLRDKGRVNVVLVDDLAYLGYQKIVQTVLGQEVETLERAGDFRTKYLSGDRRPLDIDILLLDLRLRNGDGSGHVPDAVPVDLAEETATRDPRLPIVIFSSSQAPTVDERLRRFRSVITTFRKPGVTGYQEAADGQTAVYALVEALDRAVKHHERRKRLRQWERAEFALGNPEVDPTAVAFPKELSRSLIGEDHEGQPVRFGFLCASARTVYYATAPDLENRELGLLFDVEGFQLEGLDEMSNVSLAIKANDLVLQDPGRLLWFTPTASRPRAVLKVKPRRGEPIETMMSDLSRRGAMVLIEITRDRAVLFWSGEPVQEAVRGGKWIPRKGMTRSVLLDKLTSEFPAAEHSPELLRRLDKVAGVVFEVHRHRHGALIFLHEGEFLDRVPLGPVWPVAVRGSLDTLGPGVIASFAALDGETFVDLASGSFWARQFLLGSERERIYATQDGRALESWAKGMLPDVYSHGTRHRHAALMTKVDESLVAITVSSSGKIRMWRRGVPVAP